MAAVSPAISICVCTFRRPRGLRRLLDSLHALDSATPSFEVIVVDNGPDGGARAVVDEDAIEQAAPRFSLRYFHEPAQNIARARNRSLDESRGRYIAFIDDDEEAEPGWLLHLWEGLRTHQADCAFGPVVTHFTGPTPRWAPPLFERPRLPTGSEQSWQFARTGNALVRREALGAPPARFDESFGLSGGEDGELFRRLWARGAKLIAVDEAVVVEHTPPARATLSAIVSRQFRIGSNLARLRFRESPWAQLWLPPAAAVHAALRTGVALLVLPFSGVEGIRRGLVPAARSAGMIAGSMGKRSAGYAHKGEAYRE